MKTENLFLELNGEIVGYVVSEDDETLLIRKGHLWWRESTQCFLANGSAVFVERSLVKSYWAKLVRSSWVVEPIDIVSSRKLVSEFFNV